MPHDVFHHHYGAVHNHSEVQRAQRQQVRRNLAQVEEYGCEEQGKRNGKRNDKGPANIAEKEKQDDRDQDHSFGHVMKHRVERVVQQVSAVEHGNDLHALRQDGIVELFHLLMDRVQRGSGIGAFAQQRHALDDFWIVDDGPIRLVVRSCHGAEQDFWALLYFRYVFDSQRRSAFCRQDGILNVLHRGVDADGANVELLSPLLYKTSAGIHVVVRELLLDLANAQTVRHKLVRVDAHLVFAGRAAERGYVDNIRDRLEFLFKSPVLDRL